jgi:DNA-binding NarL/FixJ family response regulator
MMSVLSGGEREVMLLICRGLPNEDIARELNLSEDTVRVHLHNIFRKLAMRNRAALASKRNGRPPENDE